ncbi:MAG: hypothetical protein U0X74_16435 [Anaerolineales bacterium]
MHEEDKRNKLQDTVFTYRANKDGKVFIYWHNKQVKILKGKKHKNFLSKMSYSWRSGKPIGDGKADRKLQKR